MNLKRVFQRSVFISFAVLLCCGLFTLETLAYSVEKQNVLQEIGDQEETIVIGQDEETEDTSAPQSTVDIDYSGKIDATTGEAVVGNIVSSTGTYYVLKKNELAYDSYRQQYHLLCGDRGLYSNVPADAILTHGESLKLSADEGVTYEIYLDGTLLDAAGQTEFEESGEYHLIVHNHAQAKERDIRIVILDEVVKDLREYRLPTGFEYTEVLLDGIIKSVSYNNYYDFLEEGHYELKWENSKINQSFVTEFTLDCTAPKLRLPEVKNKVATGNVTFEDLEEGAYVRWIRNSKEEGRIEDPSEVLSQKGNYVIRVYDQAGNYTQYSFAIEGYFDVNAILAILFVVALIGGGFAYCRRLRTHMRVG